MEFSRRSRSNKLSNQTNRPRQSASGHRRSLIESLESRQLLSAAASPAAPALTSHPAIVQTTTETVVGSVNGLVTDANGNAIANAHVVAVSTTSSNSTSPSATTNSTGHYSIPQVVAGTYKLTASATGYVSATSASFTVAAGDNTAPTLKLAAIAAGSVSGVVKSPTGSPIGNVTVAIFTSPSTVAGATLTTKTNSSGQYTFPTVPLGTYMIRGEASAYMSATSTAFAVKLGSNTAPTLVLSQAAIITGTVTDGNGTPISGAEVTIAASTAATVSLGSASTNANGQYAFLSLPPGTYVVHGTHSGYTAATSAPFTTVAGNNTAPTLKLTAIVYGTVSGLVTDSKGNPIANASIYLAISPAATNAPYFTAKTNANGQYTISEVPLGTYTVHAEAAGYGSAVSSPFIVGQGTTTAPTLILTQVVTITGTVTDANGTPVASAGVALITAGGTSVVASTTTNSSGQYTFQGVAAGSYVVRGSKDGYVGATSASFTVAPGSNTAPTLKLTQIIYGSVSGLVTDSKGNPIANASVYVSASPAGNTTSGFSTTTNASGQYTIPTVPIGTYIAHAEAAGYGSATSAAFTVAQGSNTAPILVLTQTVTITGTVTDANGTLLAGVSVSLLPATGTNVVTTVTTNSSGQYTISGVAAGSYVVRGSKDGYVGATSAPFTVAPGSNSAPTLKLTQIVYGSVTGLVTDSNGNPLANISVILTTSPASNTSSFTAKTNSSGQYTIPTVPLGTYTVHAEAAGYGSATSAPFTVGQGTTTAPTLVLTQVVTITGTVTDGGGTPLASVGVSLIAAGTTTVVASTTTNSSGQYSFAGVPAGSYVVRGAKDGYVSATSASFTVAPGSNTAPTLVLIQIITGSITGLVTDSNGNPIANASVYVSPSPAGNTTSGFSTTTNASGQYTIPTVPAGTYTVHAEAAGYGSATSSPFTVGQGSNTAPTLSLTQIVAISGTVTDGGGIPLASAGVSLIAAGTTTVVASTTTNSSGQYSFSGVPAGSYVVRGAKDGYVSATSASFTVAPGSNAAPTLVLIQIITGSITGLVTDSNGNPIANASVLLSLSPTPASNSSFQTTTNASGQYTLPTVPVGTYVVQAGASGYTSATSAAFAVGQGSNTAPTLQLAVRTTLTGLVTNAGGTPLGNVKVSLFLASSNSTTPIATFFTGDTSGMYGTDSIPAGSYIVTASATGYVTATSAAFTIVPGANVAPTLVLTVAVTPPNA